MGEKAIYKGQSVIELIKKRTSIRTYDGKPLPVDVKDKLTAYSNSVKGPFEAGVRFVLADNNMRDEPLKLGTYGIIKNAPSFIIAVVEEKERRMEQVGYMLENVILYAESLSLGTCWLGGTFSRSGFAKAAGIKKGEEIPIVSPVGFPAENRRMVDRMMRLAAGSKNRKNWDELFFDGSFEKSLARDRAGIYEVPLEMVRLAPSASNKQPWRIVMDGGNFHFYLQHSKGYAKALGHDIQKIDMGIAMCHFESSSKELGIRGAWVLKQLDTAGIPEDAEYMISWETI